MLTAPASKDSGPVEAAPEGGVVSEVGRTGEGREPNNDTTPTPYYSDESVTLWHGDALNVLTGMRSGSVDCVVTSPPYFGLRDYGVDGQIGLEPSPSEYVESLRAVFAEVRRVLVDDGTLWLNLGDSYASNAATARGRAGFESERGSDTPTLNREHQGRVAYRGQGIKAKDLMGIPWRVAFALQDDDWTLRNAVVWHKPNAMPESVTDRLSNRYEPVFLFSKSRRYWFDLDPIREPAVTNLPPRDCFRAGALPGNGQPGNVNNAGMDMRRGSGNKNPGDVWSIPTAPFSAAHFATFPVALAERCIQAGCKPDGTVLDPFSGSGTTGLAAAKHGRRYVGIDLNRNYLDLSLRTRLSQTALIEDVTA